LRNRAGQRPVELIERRAGLQRRGRVDEVGHRLRLHQIDPTVEEGAQRELPRLGDACARRRRRRDDRAEHHRAAVCADFHYLVAGIRVLRRKECHHRVIDRPQALHSRRIRLQPDLDERGMPRLERSVTIDHTSRDCVRLGTAQAHDADPASSRRRRDRDDRIRDAEHGNSRGWGLGAWTQDSRFSQPASPEPYLRSWINTVFENASPTLSVVTPGTSATAMWTIRRSYGLSGPSCWSSPESLAFSARNFAILRSSMSLPLRYSSASTKTRFSPSKPRPYDESTMCCSALSGSPR